MKNAGVDEDYIRRKGSTAGGININDVQSDSGSESDYGVTSKSKSYTEDFDDTTPGTRGGGESDTASDVSEYSDDESV